MLVVCIVVMGSFPGEPIATGRAYHYRAGTFREVANNRGMELRGDVLGYASVPDCSRIGDLVLARVGKQLGWFQILDCSHPRDLAAHRAKRLIIEVNYDVAEAGGWEWDYDTGRGVGKTDAAIYRYRKTYQSTNPTP